MVKFVIWGNGRLGRDVCAILGKERTAAFIEGNTSLHGKRYQGIPIIPFDEYPYAFSQYPIIVTPNDYETEISRFLEEKGIRSYFLNSYHMRYMASFLLQVDREMLMHGFPKEEKIIIYGYTLAGILIYEYFVAKGYECRMVIEREKEGLNSYVTESLQIKTLPMDKMTEYAKNCILTANIPESDLRLTERFTNIVDFLQIEKQTELFEHRELERFKDIHCGKRCFIVGTGPSLRMSDLDTLYQNKELCMSVNGIFKAFSDTQWRPDYYVVSDPSAIVQYKQEILDMDVKEKFIADWAYLFEEGEATGNIHKWHKNIEWDEKSLPLFSEDFTKALYYGTTVTYKALQIAVYMGVKEIYLLGVDCSWNSAGKNHFTEDYDDLAHRSAILHTEKNLLAYQSAERYARSHNIRIYNAARGGQLEVFRRVDFDTLF